MFTRHIDVANNLVFINELDTVAMDLSRLPEDVTYYIEIDDYWRVERKGIMFYPLTITTNNKDWDVRKIALEILDEAVILWEEERGLKFEPDIWKNYRKEVEEIERLANEELNIQE